MKRSISHLAIATTLLSFVFEPSATPQNSENSKSEQEVRQTNRVAISL